MQFKLAQLLCIKLSNLLVLQAEEGDEKDEKKNKRIRKRRKQKKMRKGRVLQEEEA